LRGALAHAVKRRCRFSLTTATLRAQWLHALGMVLHPSFLVEESWRGRGVGRQLVTHAEMEARARQCVGLYLDTFDSGAAQFYERCGFSRFGQIDDFPLGYARAFLYKKLPPS
jgi:GNAT superfamily N-acetyltransferase